MLISMMASPSCKTKKWKKKRREFHFRASSRLSSLSFLIKLFISVYISTLPIQIQLRRWLCISDYFSFSTCLCIVLFCSFQKVENKERKNKREFINSCWYMPVELAYFLLFSNSSTTTNYLKSKWKLKGKRKIWSQNKI